MFLMRPRPWEASCRAGGGSDAHCATGETCSRRTPSVTACTGRGRSSRATPATPAHPGAAGEAAPRSAAATSPGPAKRPPAPAAQDWLPACSASDARPGSRRRHQRPPPGRRRAHRCGQSPVTPTTASGPAARRSPDPTNPQRSPAKSPHAPQRPDGPPADAEDPGEHHPSDAETVGSVASTLPATAPSSGATPHPATSPTAGPAARC